MARQSRPPIVAVALICSCVSLLAAAQSTPPPAASSNHGSRTLPDFLITADVSINGMGPYAFLVDTGTNTTLVDPTLAAELAMTPVDRIALRTVNDSQTAVRYFADSVIVGSVSLRHLEALATPLTVLQRLDPAIRGVLGMNFLLHFSFKLDYDQQRFAIYSSADPAALRQGVRLKVRINDGRILVPAVSSSAPAGSWYLGLDSGIDQLLLFEDRINIARNECQSGACLMLVSTNEAQNGAETVVINDIDFAGSIFHNLPVIVSPSRQERRGDVQDGLLPASLFRSVVFDRATTTLIVGSR